MKKSIAIFCTLLMLILPSCHRGTYEGIYEDESNTVEEETTKILIDGIEVRVEYIRSENGQGYYEGMSTDEIIANYKKAAKSDVRYKDNTPLGYIVYERNGGQRFYNKITGSYSYLCSDILCDHESECFWRLLNRIEYISDNYIYFTAYSETRTQQFLYRCDFQRNNIEMLCERPTYAVNSGSSSTLYFEPLTLFYEKDNCIYYEEREYVGRESSDYIFKRMDLTTNKVTVLDDTPDTDVVAVIDDAVYYKVYCKDTEPITIDIYRASLDFSSSEKFLDDASIHSYNSEKIIYTSPALYYSDGRNELYAYDLSSGDISKTGKYDRDYVMSGEHLYYTKSLTGDEYADDEFYDYYCYVGEDNSKAASDGGMLWRKKLDGSGEECLLKLTYDGYPINIESYYVDGNCIYLSFYTYKEFENFYNPVYSIKKSPLHYAVADISSGEFTILE